MEKITSRSNPKIKQARALRERKARQAEGAFLVEGIHPVGAAVEAGADLVEVFYAPELLNSSFAYDLIAKLSDQGVPCYATAQDVFTALAGKENPQGIIAVARQSALNLGQLTPVNFPWGVALVSPQDPGNVGAILRTIDAVGASGLLLLESSVDPYHPTSVRASMGTIFWHPVVMASFLEFASWAQGYGYQIYGTSAHGSRPYLQVEVYPRPLVLLMGSEREGLSSEQAAICQELIKLPMLGHATSLNLAVAAGVLLYAVLGRS